jgi:hypothetical protein
MAIYAVIENGIVINTLIWDGNTSINFPEGILVIEIPSGEAIGIGWNYTVMGGFIQPIETN